MAVVHTAVNVLNQIHSLLLLLGTVSSVSPEKENIPHPSLPWTGLRLLILLEAFEPLHQFLFKFLKARFAK